MRYLGIAIAALGLLGQTDVSVCKPTGAGLSTTDTSSAMLEGSSSTNLETTGTETSTLSKTTTSTDSASATSTETSVIQNALANGNYENGLAGFGGDGSYSLVQGAGKSGGPAVQLESEAEENEQEAEGNAQSAPDKRAAASTAGLHTTLSNLEVGTSYTVLFYYAVVSSTKTDTCRLRAYLGDSILASTAYFPLVAEGSAITWNRQANVLSATFSTEVLRFTLSCKAGGSANIYLDAIFVTNQATPDTIDSVPKDYSGSTSTTTATTGYTEDGRQGNGAVQLESSAAEGEHDTDSLRKRQLTTSSGLTKSLTKLTSGASYSVSYQYSVLSLKATNTCRIRAYLDNVNFGNTPMTTIGVGVTRGQFTGTMIPAARSGTLKFILVCSNGGNARVLLDTVVVKKQTVTASSVSTSSTIAAITTTSSVSVSTSKSTAGTSTEFSTQATSKSTTQTTSESTTQTSTKSSTQSASESTAESIMTSESTTESTASTESTVSTESTASTESTVSTESTASTESITSTESTVSTESTAPTESTVSTESTASTESITAIESTVVSTTELTTESTIESTTTTESTTATESTTESPTTTESTTTSSTESTVESTTTSESTTESASSTESTTEASSSTAESSTGSSSTTESSSTITDSSTTTESSSTTPETSTSTTSTAAPTATIDSTILIIAPDAYTGSTGSAGLQAYGIPYTVLVVPSTGIELPTLNSSTSKGNYGGIIIMDAVSYEYSTGWASAITTAQWTKLHAYQADFNVRMVRINEYPGVDFGTSVVSTGCCGDTVEQMISFTDVSDFPTANIKAGAELSTKGLYHVPAKISDTTTTKQVAKFGTATGFSSESVAAVINNFNGREQFVWFIGWAPDWSQTSAFLQHAHIHWMTRGLFLGKRKVHLGCQVDDMQLSTELYLPYGEEYKISLDDIEAHITWQNSINSRMPAGSSFLLEFAHNGNGDFISATSSDAAEEVCDPDSAIYYDSPNSTALEFVKVRGTGEDIWPGEFEEYGWTKTCAELDDFASWFLVADNLNQFAHVSHTFSHLSLNNATYHDTAREIRFNQEWLAQMGIDKATKFSAHGLVPPAITGMHNGDAIQAWMDNGITHVVGDNTRPVLRNSANKYWPLISSVADNGYDGLTIVPRFSTAIYFNCATAECCLQEWIKTSAGSGDFSNLLTQSKAANTRNLLSLMADPYMFHQANMRQTNVESITIGDQSGSMSLVMSWTETIVQEMIRLTNWPMTTLKHDDIAQYFLDKQALDGCNPKLAYTFSDDGLTIKSVTVTTTGNTCSVPVPVTIPSGSASVSGGSVKSDVVGSEPPIQWVTLNGSPVTLTLSAPISF